MSILETFKFSSEDKRSAFTLAFLLVFFVLIAFGYFIWGRFLNFGHLSLIGPAPFTVSLPKLEERVCSNSPCDLKLKAGTQNLVISKAGFNSLKFDTFVDRWSTKELRLNFEITPTIAKTDQVPTTKYPSSSAYALVVDEISGLQKLVIKNDPLLTPIIFFQNPLNDARILGGDSNYLLIITRQGEAFKVDIRGKSRDKFTGINATSIISGVFSPDGRYFIFVDSNSDYLKLLDTDSKKITFTLLRKDSTLFEWLYDNSIIFITKQGYLPDTTKSSSIGDLVIPTASESNANLLFGKYSVFYNEYTKIDLDIPLTSYPESLHATQNGSEVYLQSGGENFKIILRKF